MLIDRSGYICDLYRQYSADLLKVISRQRELANNWTGIPFFDDIEAELLYLLIRDTRPRMCVEIGSGSGWSTSWALQGLRDNRFGHLVAIDGGRNAGTQIAANIPRCLTGRLVFHHRDVRLHPQLVPDRVDFMHLDAEHTSEFVEWFIETLLPRAYGTVCVHDVYYQSDVLGPDSWGIETARPILRYLDGKGLDHFTPANCFPGTYDPVAAIRQELGIVNIKEEEINTTMVFEHD